MCLLQCALVMCMPGTLSNTHLRHGILISLHLGGPTSALHLYCDVMGHWFKLPEDDQLHMRLWGTCLSSYMHLNILYTQPRVLRIVLSMKCGHLVLLLSVMMEGCLAVDLSHCHKCTFAYLVLMCVHVY